MAIFIGTSGWRYKEWGKKFYPEKLKQDEFLPFYASKFITVEVNTSFYHLPKPQTFAAWGAAVPKEFQFAVKMSRYITHILRLENAREPLENFLANAMALGPKLGPILVQLPPSLKFNKEIIAKFLEELTAVAKEAQPARSSKGGVRFRFALEARNRSWFAKEAQPDLMGLLKKHKIAFVFGHSSKYPYPENEPVTAKFIYLRFHGPGEFAGSLYGKKLMAWVPKMKAWSKQGIDVYAYFNNDRQAYAVRDVILLKKLTGA